MKKYFPHFLTCYRWIITDIIGAKHGLGVENLSGSGLIAGETSLAYEEIFTITLVTGRSVGIGAYLVRLGQRTVQTESPIILTGAPALNKVLGKDVYESNTQIGGQQIMYPNGITHVTAQDDLGGIAAIIRWLSFVPLRTGAPTPVFNTRDDPERDIEFALSGKYDSRGMLTGTKTKLGMCSFGDKSEWTNKYIGNSADGTNWVGGFFDKDSFMETLGGWGKTVITGRARLGGIPIGVIAVETQTVERVVPADPADYRSQEEVLAQPAQVWFPDSAYKTAQAIQVRCDSLT